MARRRRACESAARAVFPCRVAVTIAKLARAVYGHKVNACAAHDKVSIVMVLWLMPNHSTGARAQWTAAYFAAVESAAG